MKTILSKLYLYIRKLCISSYTSRSAVAGRVSRVEVPKGKALQTITAQQRGIIIDLLCAKFIVLYII